MTDGIDISNHNGEYDWNAWNGHIEFGIVKASESTNYHDPQFVRNWDSMMGLGINRFAYHYFHPAVDPASQAHFFYNFVASAGFGEHDNFALDLEENNGMAPSQVSFAAYVFLKELGILAPGHKCLVYTNPSFADAGNCAQLGAWPLWIANWDTPVPHVPGPWKAWTFWQTAFHSVGRDVFNGSVKQLDQFCEWSQPKSIEVKVAKWTSHNPPWNSTLSGIAAHYNVPGGWVALARFNGIDPAKAGDIKPGEVVLVPA